MGREVEVLKNNTILPEVPKTEIKFEIGLLFYNQFYVATRSSEAPHHPDFVMSKCSKNLILAMAC